MTPSTGSHRSLHRSADPPDVKARDQRVVEALEEALAGSINTLTTYLTRWRSFAGWCDGSGLIPLPASPDTVAGYLEAHAGYRYETLRLAACVITKAHDVMGHPSPCKDPGVKDTLQQLRIRRVQPRPEVGVLTSVNCLLIRKWAKVPRRRGRGLETAEHADRRGLVDGALAYVMSEGGLSALEASELTWGDVRHWYDGSGRITVPRSLSGGWSQAAIVAVTDETMDALDAMRPPAAGSDDRVFKIGPAQIGRRLRDAARDGGVDNCETVTGRSGRASLLFRLTENGAPDHVVERQARRMQPNGIVGRYTSDACASEALPYL